MSNGIPDKKTSVDKWQSMPLLFSPLANRAFLVPQIEELAVADAVSRGPGRGEQTGLKEHTRWERIIR
jgi:hypothetical protein